jgi:DNA-binding NarL/FixJ family response regulator
VCAVNTVPSVAAVKSLAIVHTPGMPRGVQYCTSADGARIAWASAGDGPPLLFTAQPGFGNAGDAPFDDPTFGFLRGYELIWFDGRGTGFSQRDGITSYTLETIADDLEAVAAATGHKQLAICGAFDGGPVAITYAARYPARVSHLVLIDGWIDFGDWKNHPVERLWQGVGHDWALFTDAMVRVGSGLGGDAALTAAARVRQNVAQQAFFDYWTATHAWNVAPVLPAVGAPTMVLHSNIETSRQAARTIAAGIPGARLTTCNWREEPSAVRDLLLDFIGAPASPQPDSEANLTPREVEVLRLVAAGRSNRQIAEQLVLSERTVVRHIANIYTKIDAHGRAGATAYAIRRGLA